MTAPDLSSIRLPLAVGVTVVSMVLSGGIAWGMASREASNLRRDLERVEKRLEQQEAAIARIVPLLERIDERTAQLARQSQPR